MNQEYLKAIAEHLQSIDEAKKKKLDPVDDSELDGDHDDREDKDIDNDGDADKSDEYLHAKRKAIKKSIDKKKGSEEDEQEVQEGSYGKKKMKEDDDPCWDSHKQVGTKKKNGKTVPNCVPKESSCGYDRKKVKEGYVTHNGIEGEILMVHEDQETADVLFDGEIRTVKLDDLEESKQTAGATKGEGIMDKESPKSKKFAKDHEGKSKYQDYDEKGHDDVSSAGKVTKQSPSRGNDQLKNGDKLKKEEVEDTLEDLLSLVERTTFSESVALRQESREIQSQIDALQKRKVMTGGHGKRAKIQAQIDALKKKLK